MYPREPTAARATHPHRPPRGEEIACDTRPSLLEAAAFQSPWSLDRSWDLVYRPHSRNGNPTAKLIDLRGTISHLRKRTTSILQFRSHGCSVRAGRPDKCDHSCRCIAALTISNGPSASSRSRLLFQCATDAVCQHPCCTYRCSLLILS